MMKLRIGIDLGGTKIEGVLLGPDGGERARRRIPAPPGDYRATIGALAGLVVDLERSAGGTASVGIGMPGSISPATGLVQNANSVWLNGRPLQADMEQALGRPIRFANDANCFTVSEAADGAAAGARSVLGVILGTGCGGGIVIDGRLVDGPQGIGGEWGHNPLPWPNADEFPGPICWCGRRSCMETWVSGTALAADHLRVTQEGLSSEDIVARALGGDPSCRATLERHSDRLARGLAHVVNLIDPEVIVLGGGLSKLNHLYREVPVRMKRWIFADTPRVDMRPPRWGDASGVRGAAWLWS
jgi:fructokinase